MPVLYMFRLTRIMFFSIPQQKKIQHSLATILEMKKKKKNMCKMIYENFVTRRKKILNTTLIPVYIYM